MTRDAQFYIDVFPVDKVKGTTRREKWLYLRGGTFSHSVGRRDKIYGTNSIHVYAILLI